MPLVVTPGHLSRQAEFYHQLGSLLSAGVGVIQALEQLQRAPPARWFRRPLADTLGLLREGTTFTEALGRSGTWLPSFDLALLQAGEQSGRLDACCRLLAGYYESRAQMARSLMADLAYPVFLLHAGVFLFPFPQLFLTGNVAVYLGKTVGALAPLYGLVLVVLLACQGRRGERWRSVIERALRPLPLLGTARRSLALARLAAALEALLNAGVGMLQAWPLAAAASGSPALRRVVASWAEPLQAGSTPAELLRASPEFPEVFANLYHTGEISGGLDETLKRLYAYYQEEASRKFKLVVQWGPRLVYLGIMLLIAWRVVSFYLGYFAEINKAIGP